MASPCLRGSSADQSLAAAAGLTLLLVAIVISLPIEFAGPLLILPAVVVEETLKFAVLKTSAWRARGYGSVLWLAAWELPISKGFLVYGISDAEAPAWMDANFPVMITGSLSAFLMHVVTARLFYRVPNPVAFLLLAVAMHYATNWTVRFEDPLAMLVIAGVKVIAFVLLILGLPLNRDETAAARA